MRNKNKFVLEVDIVSIDAPLSDIFTIKEVWIVLASSENSNECIFYRGYKTHFRKSSMMKPFIKAKSEQAVIWVGEEWIKLAHEGGFLSP